ncbi:MAG: AAA family ATPase, partial [Ruminococcaceae bacterium]|nr:AAA family ATPase [Oscillospiraceae bacterium]
MRYLEYFLLPNQRQEDDFILNFPPELEQSYNPENAYPFKIFPFKGVEELTFEPITILYGGNGSGKSTILNVIAEKLRLDRASPFNRAACFTPYVERCRYRLDRRYDRVPRESRIVTSDDVFDYL